MFTLQYSEGPGTSKYVVLAGSEVECKNFVTKWDTSVARWEMTPETEPKLEVSSVKSSLVQFNGIDVVLDYCHLTNCQ
jgi:hypothetical protein